LSGVPKLYCCGEYGCCQLRNILGDNMMKKLERLTLAGLLFIVAGAAFMFSGILGERGIFFILGSAFIAIGSSYLVVARKRKGDEPSVK
jgi:hypothetical protein